MPHREVSPLFGNHAVIEPEAGEWVAEVHGAAHVPLRRMESPAW